jgi:hypothetical protein
VPREDWVFLLVMAAGSIVGTFIGGLLLGLVPNYVLLPAAGCAAADFSREGVSPQIAPFMCADVSDDERRPC